MKKRTVKRRIILIGGFKMGYKHLIFPKGSRFLVTGGAGFIGSAVWTICQLEVKKISGPFLIIPALCL